ncbi:MAG: VWA domain-containing protein [Myxococcales bacterium]|nr:VWA domain-containing protein [Myxococcales bacterium]
MKRALMSLVLAVWLPAVAASAEMSAGNPTSLETAESAAPVDRVEVSVHSPAPGEVIQGAVHQAEIVGAASAESGDPRGFDVMLVIDVSESTRAASGTDVDADGAIGVNPAFELLPPGAYPPGVHSTDPQDTVLHAEILAARALVESLDASRVRVGVLSFAGEVDPTTGRRKRMDQRDAWLEVPLTFDYGKVDRALTAVLARGANGATNYAAGLRLAITELAGLPGALSSPRAGARRVVLFLTDGMPTLPIGKGNISDAGDVEAAVRAAELAKKAGITINTYAMGAKALQYPRAATEMSRTTLGTYTPVQRPGDIVALLQGVTFADVEDVVLTNLTTGDLSTDVRLSPDGSFNGYVPVTEGVNRVRVSALASDGSEGSVEFDLDFKLGGLTEREKQLELERMRRLSRELLLRRERDSVERFRESQRKELELRGGEAN